MNTRTDSAEPGRSGEGYPVDALAVACARVSDGLRTLSEKIGDEILLDVEEYRSGSVTREMIVEAAQGLIGPALAALPDDQPPPDDVAAFAQMLGHERAEQRMPPESILRAFQIAFRAVWEALADAIDPREHAAFRRGMTTLWVWLRRLSDAFVEGHQTSTRENEQARQRLVERFIDVAQVGDDFAQAVALAMSLGFDPAGVFRVILVRASLDPARVRAVMTSAERVEVAGRGLDTTIVVQGADVTTVRDAISPLIGVVPTGFGAERGGIDGLRRSIVDAERALLLSQVLGHPVTFDDEWAMATLLVDLEHLEPLLAREIAAATSAPHLLEAVETLANHRFNQTDAAKELHLRAHSIGYRLRRWHETTGGDPFSVGGALAARLARLSTSSTARRGSS